MSDLNVLRRWVEALKQSEPVELQSSESLNVIPLVDGQGALNVGNGTKDMDVKVFMGGDGSYVLFDESAKQLILSGVNLVGGSTFVTDATTARTVTSADYGKIIQLTNASACTVTLPAPATANVGAVVTVQTRTDAAHVVSLAEKITGLANLTGDTLTAAETNKIGQVVQLVSDGSTWNVVSQLGSWTLGDT